jgi:membrane protein
MDRKPSRLRRLREGAQALLAGRPLHSPTELSKWHLFAHFWVMVGRSFVRNRCPVRASALAYASMLALIPMLAVAVSITSSLLKKQGEESIDRFIEQLVASVTSAAIVDAQAHGPKPSRAVETPSQPADTNAPPVSTNNAAEASREPAQSVVSPGHTNAPPVADPKAEASKGRRAIARYIHQFIQNTRSTTLGLTGSLLLIVVAISMLSRIEDTFNDIWGIARGRSWLVRVVLYWSIISLVPVLLAVALGLATGPHLRATKQLLATMPLVGRFVTPVIFEVVPIAVLCVTFALLYMLMPNTKVHWRAALAGGLAGGILFHLNNVVSVLYVSRVVSNSKIYGSLGLVPVFMIGLYLSWLILLFGAQVAYAYQNRAAYFEQRQVENVNQRGREFIALRLMTCVGQRFVRGEPPPGLVEIAGALAVPTRLAQQIMQTLCAARLVAEVSGAEPAYLPARPLDSITCHDILLAMRAAQGQELATRDEAGRAEVYGEFCRIEEAERKAAASVNMLALVNRAGGRNALTE